MEKVLENNELNIKEIEELKEFIPSNSVNKNVCIFGQGFVGLPLALSFAIRGCNVTGVDIDDILIANTNRGITHHTEKFYDITIQEILKMQLKNKRYKATTDSAAAVQRSNNIIVTVGIPIHKGKYNMDFLAEASRVIGKNLKKDDLVIIRSTVIPGTTDDFIKLILEEESSMKAGEDFYLAYSSERIAEGKAFDEFADMPTLVAGINEKSCERAAELLKIVCKAEIVRASCIKAVETSKVFENVQRDVNIAMVQEFARFTEAMKIDIFEVIKLANTHKRVNLLVPGPGVGGYCIPNAYHYLSPKAEELAINLDILKLSREKNSRFPEFIVNKVEELLKKQGKKLSNSKIAVLGLAMKDYSNDDRISPPVDICKLLIEKGAEVRAFDPAVLTNYDFKVKTEEEALKSSDGVVILAKQSDINFEDIKYMSMLMNEKPIFVDIKGVIDKKTAEEHGMIYWRI